MANPSSSQTPSSQPPVWKMPMKKKEAVLKREADNKLLLLELGIHKRCNDNIRTEIQEKRDFIALTSQEVKEAKAWVRTTKAKIHSERIRLHSQETKLAKKQADLDKEKKEYPHEFPEFQVIDD